jgi:hypothetical protein
VPLKINALMDGDNAAAGVRAALALEELNQQSRADPVMVAAWIAQPGVAYLPV